MKDAKKMDLESLDELISRCEDAMVSPFKKKKAAVAIEVKPEEGSDEEEGEESQDEESHEDSKPELSDDMIEELLRQLQEKQGKE